MTKKDKQIDNAGESPDGPQPAPIVVIDSIDQLTALLSDRIDCQFAYKGTVIRIPVTALSASTAEKVRALRRAAVPPFKRERGPNGGYDDYDAVYTKSREDNEKKARALIVYTHCPAVAKGKPGLTDTNEIFAYVQGLWSENILEIISLTIQGGGLSTDLEERVDFTLAGGSPI